MKKLMEQHLEKAKALLDELLQRCQEYSWKDLPTEVVADVIKRVKVELSNINDD